MKIEIGPAPKTRPVGAVTGGVEYTLLWPGGRDGLIVLSTIAKTAAYFQSHLALLAEPENAQIRAACATWAKAGGRRMRTIAVWKWGNRESLSEFISRAKREVAKLPASPVRRSQVAWIDEADLR